MKTGLRFCTVLVCLILVFVSCGASLAASVYEPPFAPEAESVYIVNEDTGLVIYSKNADQKMYPASLTKIMAGLLVLESGDLSRTATMNRNIANLISGTGSVVLNLEIGEEISLKDLLYAFMLKSAGDAVLLAAELVGGTVDNFVAMMNERAAALGCTNTHFVNPHGLHDDNHYTTASDLYKIIAEAMKNQQFREICNTTRYTVPATNKSEARLVVTTNLMLSANLGGSLYYEPVHGIKTGFTTPAGPCLASVATKNNQTYTIIVLKSTAAKSDGSVDRNGAISLSKQLFEWLFSTYKLQTLLTTTDVLRTIPVQYAKDVDSIGLVPSEDFVTVLPKNADESSVVIHYDVLAEVPSPVENGTPLGTAYVEISGEKVGEIELVAAENVQRNDFLYVLAQIGKFFTSKAVVIILIVLAVLVVAYIALNIAYNRGRRNRASGSKSRRRRRKTRADFR